MNSDDQMLDELVESLPESVVEVLAEMWGENALISNPVIGASKVLDIKKHLQNVRSRQQATEEVLHQMIKGKISPEVAERILNKINGLEK